MANNEDIYIEDRIAILEKQMEFILDKNFEDRILNLEDMARDDAEKFDSLADSLKKFTVLEDRVSTLEDIIETDGEKLDALREEHEALVEGVRYLRSQIIHDEPQVQQTTEEFVRVVRCKDCKWYIKDTTDPYIYDCCKNEDGMFRPSGEDYCSKGERK